MLKSFVCAAVLVAAAAVPANASAQTWPTRSVQLVASNAASAANAAGQTLEVFKDVHSAEEWLGV